MTGVQLIAVGHAAIARAHELILLGGVLGLASILAGLISRRVEMAGGAVLGLGGGWALARALRHLRLEASLAPVLVLAGGLAIFGLSQLLGTGGFLVTYLAAVVTGAAQYRARQQVEHFFEGMAWLAQIVLFVMLGCWSPRTSCRPTW
jgi:potassium/hydrogen antiporter